MNTNATTAEKSMKSFISQQPISAISNAPIAIPEIIKNFFPHSAHLLKAIHTTHRLDAQTVVVDSLPMADAPLAHVDSINSNGFVYLTAKPFFYSPRFFCFTF